MTLFARRISKRMCTQRAWLAVQADRNGSAKHQETLRMNAPGWILEFSGILESGTKVGTGTRGAVQFQFDLIRVCQASSGVSKTCAVLGMLGMENCATLAHVEVISGLAQDLGHVCEC